jgi:hypothetical protein
MIMNRINEKEVLLKTIIVGASGIGQNMRKHWRGLYPAMKNCNFTAVRREIVKT